MNINVLHKYNTRSSTNKVNHVKTFRTAPNIFKVGAAEKMTKHIGKEYLAHIDPRKDRITVEPLANYINFKTTGKILGYRDLVKMDAPVWTNSMCNELGRLSQGWKTHAGTDTIEFIFHKDKPKYRKETYVRAVCNIRPQKTETCSTRLPAGANLIDYPGYVSTPTS